MLSKIPAIVVDIHNKNKETVIIEYPDHVETVKNMLPQLKVGDFVIVNDGIIIEILTEKQAEKRVKFS